MSFTMQISTNGRIFERNGPRTKKRTSYLHSYKLIPSKVLAGKSVAEKPTDIFFQR